jgi:peptidoglycan/xylan/chitin deacetylase (PgdA/CDA1 family)
MVAAILGFWNFLLGPIVASNTNYPLLEQVILLAYPVGDPTSAGPREFRIAAELGFKTAVTTRPGVLFKGHRDHLTALPRISINGEFQQHRYLKVLMSGAATAMWNGFRRIDAA